MLHNWAQRNKQENSLAGLWTSDNAIVAFDPESRIDLAAGHLFPESFSKPPDETNTIIGGVISNPNALPSLRSAGMKAVIAELTRIATENGYLAPLSVDCASPTDEMMLRGQ